MRNNLIPDEIDKMILKELARRYWKHFLFYVYLCFITGTLCGMLSGCVPARVPASRREYVRTDFYDKNYRRTGYSIQEGNRVDYYDINNNRTGYGEIK